MEKNVCFACQSDMVRVGIELEDGDMLPVWMCDCAKGLFEVEE